MQFGFQCPYLGNLFLNLSRTCKVPSVAFRKGGVDDAPKLGECLVDGVTGTGDLQARLAKPAKVARGFRGRRGALQNALLDPIPECFRYHIGRLRYFRSTIAATVLGLSDAGIFQKLDQLISIGSGYLPALDGQIRCLPCQPPEVNDRASLQVDFVGACSRLVGPEPKLRHDVIVGTGNDVLRNQVSHALCGLCPGLDGCFHGPDVALQLDRDEPALNFLN